MKHDLQTCKAVAQATESALQRTPAHEPGDRIAAGGVTKRRLRSGVTDLPCLVRIWTGIGTILGAIAGALVAGGAPTFSLDPEAGWTIALGAAIGLGIGWCFAWLLSRGAPASHHSP